MSSELAKPCYTSLSFVATYESNYFLICSTLYVCYLWIHMMTSLNGNTWWRHHMETFPRYRPFLRGIHRSPVNSPHKGQLRGALIFSLICAWINYWVNNPEAGDLRRNCAHYDVTVMIFRVTGPLCGESVEFPSQRPVTRSFDVSYDVHLNKRLSKQSRCRWLGKTETGSYSLRHLFLFKIFAGCVFR